MNKLELLVNNDYVIKAYTTPDNKFLKVENKNGAVYTIWQKSDGYQMSSPIEPNHKTGSSTYVMGEGDSDYGSLEDVLKILKTGQAQYPNFFSQEDIQATHFLTIEQAVNLYGNIMQFKQVK